MKKGLIVLLVVIAVVCSFLVGTKIRSNESVESNTSSATNDSSVTSDFYYEDPETTLYELQGFEKIGKFDIILEINDYYISDLIGESYVITDTRYGTHGYYFDYSSVSPVQIWSADNEVKDNKAEWLDIWTERDRLRNYQFADNFTLVIEEGTFSERENIIVEDIIYNNDLCSIFIAKIDRFGYENDETLCYFAFKYNDILKFETGGTGTKWYDQNSFRQRCIYF